MVAIVSATTTSLASCYLGVSSFIITSSPAPGKGELKTAVDALTTARVESAMHDTMKQNAWSRGEAGEKIMTCKHSLMFHIKTLTLM